LICLFIVRKNKAKKYKRRIGQNTGTSKILKRDKQMEINTAFTADNLNKYEGRKSRDEKTVSKANQVK
jgi:hypothetical protein